MSANPLSSSGKPSANSKTPSVSYEIYLGTNTPNITSNTNYTFSSLTHGIIDGTTYTVYLKAILNKWIKINPTDYLLFDSINLNNIF
jgi:hypothetical protein